MRRKVTRRRVLVVGGAACATALLGGCGKATEAAGLYVTGSVSAPRWIDSTSGAPAWSPNGEALAWGDEDGLRMWNTSAGSVSAASEIPVVGRPAWSPDSLAVAFLDSQAQVLRRLDFASGVTTPLATLDPGFPSSPRVPIMTRGGPAWSPDGTRIAFVCWDGQGDELCVVDSDGIARQQVTTLGGTDASKRVAARSSVTSMAWSPDSEVLAVAVQAEQQGAVVGVFRVDLQARSGRRLTKLTANSPLIWDATSDDLIFSARVEGRSDVYRMPADGGEPKPITTALAEGARSPVSGADGAIAVVTGTRIAVLRATSDDVTYVEVPGLAASAPALGTEDQQLAFLAWPRPIDGYP